MFALTLHKVIETAGDDAIWLVFLYLNIAQVETYARGKIQVSKANDPLTIQYKNSTSCQARKHHFTHPMLFNVWSSDHLQEDLHRVLL